MLSGSITFLVFTRFIGAHVTLCDGDDALIAGGVTLLRWEAVVSASRAASV